MVRGAEFAIGNAARDAAQFHVGLAVGAVDLDLLHCARGQKAAGGADERDLAAVREAGADADHILFGNADVHQPIGKPRAKRAELGGADRIVDHRDDARVGFSQRLYRRDIGVAAVEKPGGGGRGAHADSSASAWAYCAASGTP